MILTNVISGNSPTFSILLGGSGNGGGLGQERGQNMRTVHLVWPGAGRWQEVDWPREDEREGVEWDDVKLGAGAR